MNKINEIFEKVYVVSYEGSPRLETLEERLNGLDYEVFYGVNKKDLDMEKMKKDGYKYANPPWNWSADVFACGFSHTRLWQYLKDNELHNVLILEDDVIMLEQNIEHVVTCYKELPDDWDVYFIGLNNHSKNYEKLIPLNYKGIMYKDKGYKMGDNRLLVLEGTNGYAINNDRFLDILLNRQNDPATCIASEFWPEFHLMNIFATKFQVFPQIDDKYHFFNGDIGRSIEKRQQ